MTLYTANPDLGLIVKSWEADGSLFVEGWLSTPLRDIEKDSTDPEAFIAPMQSYFDRRAPLSIEHGTKTIPIGHLQAAAVIRNGQVVKSMQHPTDPADFTALPVAGDGLWTRAVINEEPGRSAVLKGNVGGFSYIATVKKSEPLPGGRKRYKEFDVWIESTIAAYPVNPQTIFSICKAFTGEPTMTPEEIQKAIADALAARDATLADAAQKAATIAEGILTTAKIVDLEAKLLDAEARVTKALEALPEGNRGEGVGRKGTISTEDQRETDPLSYIIAKAKDGHKGLSLMDRHLIGELTIAAITEGMAT